MIIVFSGLTKYGFDRYGFSPVGYDKDDCNFLFNGPFDVLHSLKIWELLTQQDKGYLMSVYRLCPALDPVPLSWSAQFWAPNFKDVSGRIILYKDFRTQCLMNFISIAILHLLIVVKVFLFRIVISMVTICFLNSLYLWKYSWMN